MCDSKYNQYINISKYSLLLNCYFQMCNILNEKICDDFEKDFDFYQDIGSKIDKKVIKTYGSLSWFLKVTLCFKCPWIYRKSLRIKTRLVDVK